MLADTTDPVVAAFVDAYDEAVETLGSVLPTIRGGLHGRCPSLMQRNVLRPLQASTPAGWPDMASPCTCADPGWALGWTGSRKLAPVWHSSRMPGQRMRRPAIAAAAQLADEVGSMVPDLPTPAWQALLDELKTVAQHCPDRPDQ
ncbi:MAG: hypothetical protein QOD02_5238 [Mycobacterium sp.]|nr:hypothetical protein [Mycobacterium sp.]